MSMTLVIMLTFSTFSLNTNVALTDCHPAAECVDQPIGYTCRCREGYKDIGRKAGRMCKPCNSVSFSFTILHFFAIDSYVFLVVNECQFPHLNDCHQNAQCIDIEEGYECRFAYCKFCHFFNYKILLLYCWLSKKSIQLKLDLSIEMIIVGFLIVIFYHEKNINFLSSLLQYYFLKLFIVVPLLENLVISLDYIIILLPPPPSPPPRQSQSFNNSSIPYSLLKLNVCATIFLTTETTSIVKVHFIAIKSANGLRSQIFQDHQVRVKYYSVTFNYVMFYFFTKVMHFSFSKSLGDRCVNPSSRSDNHQEHQGVFLKNRKSCTFYQLHLMNILAKQSLSSLSLSVSCG
uniref:EGF-like domain-containing protein n=1 Tax=Heterorhabditis bacteriophora TaxID=37862 RepID=A0A1I7XAE8_HETBA